MTAETRTAELTSVHLITLGCARNEVDSSELAARLEVGGFQLVDDPEAADAVMVNTCGFIEAAKKDSVDTLLAAADLKSDGGKTQAVVAVGCMAERYGQELAESLPEADAVLGFDDYASVAERLQSILNGDKHVSHVPRDRRTLLPISPADRQAAAGAAGAAAIPGHAPIPGAAPLTTTTAPDLPEGLAPASGPRAFRRRLDGNPSAPLKLASGCDRRCTFCAIPSFRGAYVSRQPEDIVAEARWLAENGVREAFLVSENSSSYGKDLGDIRLLESLLGDLAGIEGLDWIRVSYLQPAETRPTLVQAMATIPGVVPYFDLSFQHASAPVLRRMRRFGHSETFLALIESIRALSPRAGIRSNVITGFPGETEEDVQILSDFLVAAGLDAVGVFGYSDEEGTEAAGFDGKLSEDEIDARRSQLTDLADELVAGRAEERIGEPVRVLIEELEDDEVIGRAEHQGPEVDGSTTVLGLTGAKPGDVVAATVVGTDGVDLIAEVDGGQPA